MPDPVVLVTGASGEIGRVLLELLARRGHEIITLDLAPLPDEARALARASYTGDVADHFLLDELAARHEFEIVFHLAALLSARGESDPERSHQVNVEGTLNVLRVAHARSSRLGRAVRVIFPSSIAVYGLPLHEARARSVRVREEDWNRPITMYGCNKLYCEHLGRYFSLHARRGSSDAPRLDFRALRLPGLLSAETVPAGGTSDFGPEMIHAAAKGLSYRCFVGPEAKIPFMAMPDAVTALVDLANADRARLSSCVYNVGAFSLSASDFAERVRQAFEHAEVDFESDPLRAEVIASWPEEVDDARARRDWGWRPAYDWDRAFWGYLVPRVKARYRAEP